MSRAAMQQALEALESYSRWAVTIETEMQKLNAIEALRDALAEQAQPVAWRYWKDKFACWEYSDVLLEYPAVPAGTQMRPLYTPAPIAPPGWRMVPVELTEPMLRAAQSAWLRDPARRTTTIYRALLAAAPEAPTPPAPQPVFCECGDEIVPDDGAKCGTCVATKTPQPLTDEDIDVITHAQWGTRLPGVMVAAHREYARAVEAEVLKRMGVQR